MNAFDVLKMLLENLQWNEYVSEYQLSQAAQLLSDHNLSIAEISEQCGFQSQSYFGKIFREKYGFSPKNYQKNLLQMKL